VTPYEIGASIQESLGRIGQADIVVGIPSYNNAGTIGHVVRAVQAGLAKYFPRERCVLVNSDGGSTDGTREIVATSRLTTLEPLLFRDAQISFDSIAAPYPGIPGKGSAFRLVFTVAAELQARSCAVVDSDLRSITPEWIELLVRPAHEGMFDYIAPLYHRHKYDGTITNSIIYPLTRALYGKRVRQPIGGDFGFSGELARLFAAQDVWETDVARYGIDIWMTTTALAHGHRVCQAFLGAKIHDPKDPGSDLSSMLYQVVGSAFELMETYESVWQAVRSSERLTTYGFPFTVGLEPVAVNLERMLEKFDLGTAELLSVWKEFLPGPLVEELAALRAGPPEGFHFPDDLWARTVYSFAIAFHRRTIAREHLLRSLTPLYIGRTASFVIDTRDSSQADVEEKTERLCESFEAQKSFLIENW
jgi:hypothetical protein